VSHDSTPWTVPTTGKPDAISMCSDVQRSWIAASEEWEFFSSGASIHTSPGAPRLCVNRLARGDGDAGAREQLVAQPRECENAGRIMP
jgi:hypothetical protein